MGNNSARSVARTITFLTALIFLLLILPSAYAASPDYSGTWIANVKRIGKDTCRRNSRKKLKLHVTVVNKSVNRITGTIKGDGELMEGTGAPLAAAFNIWKVTHTESKTHGDCTTQEGIYVATIDTGSMRAKKVNFNHNINCRKGSGSNTKHYSCHYTYKGKARRIKTVQ